MEGKVKRTYLGNGASEGLANKLACLAGNLVEHWTRTSTIQNARCVAAGQRKKCHKGCELTNPETTQEQRNEGPGEATKKKQRAKFGIQQKPKKGGVGSSSLGGSKGSDNDAGSAEARGGKGKGTGWRKGVTGRRQRGNRNKGRSGVHRLERKKREIVRRPASDRGDPDGRYTKNQKEEGRNAHREIAGEKAGERAEER